MNTNLLKKLIKLANNNPNDNEANLAARKVCRMIEEDNFSIVGGDQTRSRPIVQQQPRTDPFWDDLWSNLRKAQEQAAKQNPFNTAWDFGREKRDYAGEYYTNYKPGAREEKKGKLIPCPICGNRQWVYHDISRTWGCSKYACPGTVSDIEFHAYVP